MGARVVAASTVSAPLMALSIASYVGSKTWLKFCARRMPWESDLSNVAVDP